jgi:hypothetical protein
MQIMRNDQIQGNPQRPCGYGYRTWSAFSFVLAGFLVIVPFSPARAQTQAQPLSEYQVKAAYLFNFSRFVEWPQSSFSDPEAPLVIGIIGKDPFGPVVDEFMKTVRGRRVVIEHPNWDQKLSQYHVLFISRSEKKHLGIILGKTKGSSVLTVSEIDEFCASGGIIGFVFEDDRVRFEINLDEAAKAQLKISSKLSSMARAKKPGELPEKN